MHVGIGLAALVLFASAVFPSGCRRLLSDPQQTSMSDIEANLQQLVTPAKAGLALEVSPRFLTFGPLPSGAPWDHPVASGQTFDAQGHQISFKTGRDGLIRERYEARPCPLREIWSCVELWATGRFGKGGQLACVGLRLEKGDTIESRALDLRKGDDCPFVTAASGPAQQAVRGLEKAQLEHTERQQADRHLDPKAR
jgi:hypothetical protein